MLSTADSILWCLDDILLIAFLHLEISTADNIVASDFYSHKVVILLHLMLSTGDSIL